MLKILNLIEEAFNNYVCFNTHNTGLKIHNRDSVVIHGLIVTEGNHIQRVP